MGGRKRRASGIPNASVVAERANTPPGKLGGHLVSRDGDSEGAFSETSLEGHAFLSSATARCAEFSLGSDKAEEGVRGHGGCDGEGQ